MDKSNPNTLSIIICAYNEENTIADKIKDIFAKDKNNAAGEIIIVNDNSTDRTLEIAQGFLKNNKKLSVINNIYKKGKWGAILTGFKSAHGEIICITDVDVTFQEDTLDEALKLFTKPLVGAVTSNQKISLIKNKEESVPKVGLYEKFRNFFRKLESGIDSTMAFHGQCMFFRKACLQLNENDGLMADDLDIAVRIRRNGYRTLFCQDSYYIERFPILFDRTSRSIFRRRARAVTQVIIENIDLLFNMKYKKFGLICFPIEFLLNIILPFLVIATMLLVGIYTLLLPIKYKFWFIIFMFLLFTNRKLAIMVWYQMASVISYLVNPKKNCFRWSTPRYA